MFLQCGVGGGRSRGGSPCTLGPAASASPGRPQKCSKLESAFYYGDSNGQESLRSTELQLICQSKESKEND